MKRPKTVVKWMFVFSFFPIALQYTIRLDIDRNGACCSKGYACERLIVTQRIDGVFSIITSVQRCGSIDGTIFVPESRPDHTCGNSQASPTQLVTCMLSVYDQLHRKDDIVFRWLCIKIYPSS